MSVLCFESRNVGYVYNEELTIRQKFLERGTNTKTDTVNRQRIVSQLDDKVLDLLATIM